MSGPSTVEQIATLIERLFSAIARRVEGELSLRERLDTELADAERSQTQWNASRSHQYEAERDAIQAEYDRVCATIGNEYRAHYSATSEEYTEALGAINDEYNKVVNQARQEFEEARWMVVSYFDENAGGSPKLQFEQFEFNTTNTQEHLTQSIAELQKINDDAIALLTRRRMWTEPELPKPGKLPEQIDLLVEYFQQRSEDMRTQAIRLKKRKAPRIFSGLMPVLAFLMLTAGLAGAAYFGINPVWLRFKTAPPLGEWLGILSGAGAVISMTTFAIVYGIQRGRCEENFLELAQSFADARAAFSFWDKQSARELKKRKKDYDSWYGQLCAERDRRLKLAEDRHSKIAGEATEKHSRELAQCHARYPQLLDRFTRDRDARLAAAENEYPPRIKRLEEQFQRDQARAQSEHEQHLSTIRETFHRDWQRMTTDWFSATETAAADAQNMLNAALPVSQLWDDLAFGHWTPPQTIPHGLRLGDFHLSLADVEHGLPSDQSLQPPHVDFELPAMIPFPEYGSVLLKASGAEGRAAAVRLLQISMLRLLTTLPPGKVRLTIIDPVGLGENFSAFMHLADYDELLVTSRIWTEASHIEQRLADLTEHMETVFQTYLRNEFRTIEEYNHFAGEVAEPYRILVVAGFPASFTEQAARRLTSIMTSGPRCGVYTLLSVDPQLTMPPNFQLDHVASEATCLTWSRGGFHFDAPSINWLPFTPLLPPGPDEFVRIVKRVGDVSKDARRVEVSFERVAPRELWQQDSRSSIDIPLGRAGATKLQHLRLGKGTSQHVLVAGKTGSGKSTFMHILITNIALHYSPDEVEFFLIDFKKGVEFKTYATNRLPHARVIAIESDREFGLSVLERLDGILKERGDLFRDKGVQDVAAYRNENPGERMPRLLLLIDEFQEFFTEDDRIGQQSALLLDRLVRQGRAFGIHVLLGSQTLGGAYSLARSTLGQVAVRVALQCSESDAHLILSEENTAARLLTRPGEAIYNDANGLLEGNHPFQIAWLEDDRRDHYLARIRALTEAQALDVSPPVVFEGNIPASPFNNRQLMAAFHRTPPRTVPQVVDVWLGEAVAIKPHTSIRFRRLSGSNLIIVGQSPLPARGMLSTIMLAIAGQLPLPVPAGALHCDDLHDSDVQDDDFRSFNEHSIDRPEPSMDESRNDEPADDSGPDLTHLIPSNSMKASGSMQDALAAMKSFSLGGFSAKSKDAQIASSGSSTSAPMPVHPAFFYVLNGELADNPQDRFWSDVTGHLPHESQVGGPREAARMLAELIRVVDQRTARQATADLEPPVFLLIDNLGRFRDLRKDDDDYNFGASRGAAETPAKQFARLLKEGPAVGVHTLIWADTFSNAGRWLSSQTMRELELRVAFQMSATDSSNFIDSPVAGKLGQNRALLFLEETGTLEKFRPYGLPSEEWLAQIDSHFEAVMPSDTECESEIEAGLSPASHTAPLIEFEEADDELQETSSDSEDDFEDVVSEESDSADDDDDDAIIADESAFAPLSDNDDSSPSDHADATDKSPTDESSDDLSQWKIL